jgi:hypothetical protein
VWQIDLPCQDQLRTQVVKESFIVKRYQIEMSLLQAISNKVGIFSRNTISKWDHLDMSAQGIFQRRLRYHFVASLLFSKLI